MPPERSLNAAFRFHSARQRQDRAVPRRHEVLGSMRLLAAMLLLILGTSAARTEDGHERARDALARGEVAPLATVLAEVERRGLGQVLEVELEREHGRWIYEVETLSADGVIRKVVLDAKQPRILLPEHDDESE